MVEEETLQSRAESRGLDGHDALRTKSGVKPPPSKNRLLRYGPVVLWAVFIFIGSTSLMSASTTGGILRPVVLWAFPSASEATLIFLHFLVRKAAHFIEYAILALLLARAFRTSGRDFLRSHWFAVSLTLVALYALSDEFHQSFVSLRTASIYDCLIDTAGGLAALIIVRVRTASGSDRINQST